ncbi:MAG: PQQ-binding-like beta-propeller repeat protein [Desulfobacterales bacterium]|nr:PQQ-binding-like beta-propeller repeat protein [Desulfobacterales bacterium]
MRFPKKHMRRYFRLFCKHPNEATETNTEEAKCRHLGKRRRPDFVQLRKRSLGIIRHPLPGGTPGAGRSNFFRHPGRSNFFRHPGRSNFFRHPGRSNFFRHPGRSEAETRDPEKTQPGFRISLRFASLVRNDGDGHMRQNVLMDSGNPALVGCPETFKCHHSNPGSKAGVNCSGSPASYKHQETAPNRHSRESGNPGFSDISQNNGSVLIYIIVVMMVFGLLGAAMVAMFSSATMMSTGTPNSARQARYLAESGMRYAISKIRNEGYDAIEDLNDKEKYTLSESGEFDLNIFGKWFEAASDYPGTANIELSIPEGVAPGEDIFSVPVSSPMYPSVKSYLVNLEGYQDSFLFGNGAEKDQFFTEIKQEPNLPRGATALEIVPEDNFSAKAAKSRILLAVNPSEATQTINENGTLKVAYDYDNWNEDSKSFFPQDYGSFYVVKDPAGSDPEKAEINQYFYKKLSRESSSVALLEGLKGTNSLDVTNSDLLILGDQNHLIDVTASTGDSVRGGTLRLAMSYPQNIESPQIRFAKKSQPADISPSEITSGMASPNISKTGAIEVDSVNNQITLGGGVQSAYGTVFYSGNTSLGGVDICVDGKCKFNNGFRAFFLLEYNNPGAGAAGDGFTFAVINGDSNDKTSTGGSGGSGELMAYAGDGGQSTGTLPEGAKPGLIPPKFALEFDTYTNAGAYNPSSHSGRYDPGSSNQDYLQYVFWGDTKADLFDDNAHDLGGLRERTSPSWPDWPFTDPAGDVRSSPAVASNGIIYAGSNDNSFYFINPDGSLNLKFNTCTRWPWACGSVESSPALSSDHRYLYFGSNNNYFYIVDLVNSVYWATDLYDDVRSSPAVASNGTVYVGSDSNRVYALSPTGTLKGWPWPYVTGDDVRSSPAISPSDGTIYVGSNDNKVHAIRQDGFSKGGSWPFPTGGDIVTRPAIGSDGTVYVSSKDGKVYALSTTGSKIWEYDTGASIESSPETGSDGTVYVGSDSEYVYALDPNPSATSRVKLSYKTGGNVRCDPKIGPDGTIWIGSDDNNLYALNPIDLTPIGTFPAGGSVRTKPAIGPDDMVYAGSDADKVIAITPPCSPTNIKTKSITYEDIQDEIDAIAPNWLESGKYGIRIEIVRSRTANSKGKYEYTLKTWIRQCTSLEDCSNILGTYFQNTKVSYDTAAHPPHMEQTVEMCPSDHSKFETFLFGFTEGTGSATQEAILSEPSISFIRPGDFVVTDDPNWQ